MSPPFTTEVLHIATRFGTGGSERRIRDAVEATPELQHGLLVGREHNETRLKRDLPGVNVEVLPSLVRSPHPLRDLSALSWLRRRLEEKPPGLIHTHQSKAGVIGRLAARGTGIPTLHSLSMANFGPGFGRASSVMFRSIERALGRSTTAYAVVGTDLRNRFVELGVPSHKFTVIRSSVELERFRQFRASSGPLAAPADETAGVILHVGRYETLKGVADLPALLERVRAKAGGSPSLVLAGDGPLHDEVVRKCRLVSGRVTDLGYTDRVPEAVAAADVVVLLSRAEGVPQVLVQALAAGKPFVAFAADGVRELSARPGAESCAAVPIGDLDALSDAVVHCLRERPRTACDLDSWSTNRVYADYRELYSRLLNVAL